MDIRPLLDFVFPPQCASCNALGSGLCAACEPRCSTIRVHHPTLRITALAAYEDTARTAVLALKDGRRDVAESLGRLMAPLVARNAVLVPVPTTAKRRRVRGGDGVGLVAHVAAAIAGAGVLFALDQRSGDAQRGRSRVERLSARGRFRCDSSVAARRVTLLDDVCTTGATLRDCADAIREAGGICDEAIVVAVTLPDPSKLSRAS